MQQNSFEIVPYKEEYKDQVLKLWEQSVLATHHFLSTIDFEEIKEIVKDIDFNGLTVFCMLQDTDVMGFIGVAEQKVEMLFLSPDLFGKGLGKRLMDFAMKELSAYKVDVNEQNLSALNFYKSLGFETYERTEKDSLGKDYPILKLRIRNL